MKWVVAALAAIALLAIVAVVAIPRLVDLPRVQALIAGSAAQALGRPVRFTSLSVTVFPLPAVTLHKLEVAEDPLFGTAPFLTLDSGRLRLRLRSLLRGRMEFAELVLDKPVITVIRANGRLNVASLGTPREPRAAPRTPRPSTTPPAAAAPLALPTAARIKDGTVVYLARGQGGPPTRYRVEGLDLTLDAAPPQVAFNGRARVVPGDVAVKISDGVLTVGSGHVLSGAAVRATVALESSNVADLVAAVSGPETSVAGPLRGTLAVGGTVSAPTAAGEVKLSKLTVARVNPHCAEPRRRTLSIPSVTLGTGWREGRFIAEPVRAELPQGTVTARLTVDVRGGMRVRFDDLAVKGVPVESVLVDFLCQGYAVSGPLDLTSTLAFAAARPLETLSGPGTLKIGAGKVVGKQALSLMTNVVRVGGAVSSLLSADLPTSAFASPVEFDSITGTYQVTDGIARTRDLVYTSRAMVVGVAGDYVLATGGMNLDVVVHHGRGEVRARVTGTAAAPAIRVVPSSLMPSADRDSVERGLKDLLKQFR